MREEEWERADQGGRETAAGTEEPTEGATPGDQGGQETVAPPIPEAGGVGGQTAGGGTTGGTSGPQTGGGMSGGGLIGGEQGDDRSEQEGGSSGVGAA